MLAGQHSGQVLCRVLTEWGTCRVPAFMGLPSTERKRRVPQPPGVMGAVWGGTRPRGHEQPSSQQHWGTSLPGEEHQNQEVAGGQAELDEGGWGGGRCGRAQHLNHRIAGCLTAAFLPSNQLPLTLK